MSFMRYHWRCNEFSGTFEADTVEPSRWGGGHDYLDDSRIPKCDPRYEERVGSKRYFLRENGSGTVYQAGFSAGGFSGSSSVATSEGVSQKWANELGHTRRLCGTTDVPRGFTLVRTEA